MKYIISITMPSGNKYAWSRYKKTFALVPIEDGAVRNALAWDTEQEAQDYLDAQLEVAPDLLKMGEPVIMATQLPQ